MSTKKIALQRRKLDATIRNKSYVGSGEKIYFYGATHKVIRALKLVGSKIWFLDIKESKWNI